MTPEAPLPGHSFPQHRTAVMAQTAPKPETDRRKGHSDPGIVPLRGPQEDLRAQRDGGLRQLALGAGLDHAGALLRPVLAGMEWPPGRAVRSGRAQVLHLRPGVLAAGRVLPCRPADHLRAGAVPVHRRRRAAVLRLRLPADRLHRDLHVGREAHRGRSRRAHEIRRRADERGQAHPQDGQARRLGGDRPVDRLHLRRLLHADQDPGGIGDGLAARPLGNLLDLLLRLRHLGQRRLHARAGVQVHVPLRPLPGRDVRPRHADRHLRRRARRAARRALEEGRPQGGRQGRLRRLRHLRAGLPDRHRHPRRPAVRMHRLLGLHRRLRPGDGQDELPARSDPLFHRARAGRALGPARRSSATSCGRARCSTAPSSPPSSSPLPRD